jgi:hypothetical protein
MEFLLYYAVLTVRTPPHYAIVLAGSISTKHYKGLEDVIQFVQNLSVFSFPRINMTGTVGQVSGMINGGTILRNHPTFC